MYFYFIQGLGLKKIIKNFDSIQALRFIASLMVVILHSFYYSLERLDSFGPSYQKGSNGVPLFFAISGFVMMISIGDKLNLPGGWKNFLLKRIIRIVPLYWLCTSIKLLIAIIATKLVKHATMDASYIFKSYFFIPARNAENMIQPFLGPGWTLNFEMFFYLLLTLLIFLKVRIFPFSILILSAVAVLSIFKTNTSSVVLFYANPLVLNFALGMIAAYLLLKEKWVSNTIFIATGIVALVLLFVPNHFFGISYEENSFLTTSIACFLVIFGAVVLELNTKLKIPRWILFLGDASYSIYLIHPLIAPIAPTLLKKMHLPFPYLSVVLSIFVSLVAGSWVYKYVEKPITDILNQRFVRRKMS